MLKIIGALLMSSVGLLLLVNGYSMPYYMSNRAGFLFVGGIAQFGAAVLFLYGLRDFFVRDIIAELKNIISFLRVNGK